MGRVPAPPLEDGMYLVDILFKIGPVKHEAPLSEGDIEPWERRRGIQLAPWQAELIVDMSKAYLGEMYNARHISSLCPWPPGRNVWKYVQDELHAKPKKQPVEGTPRNGSRQRH